MTWQTNLRQVSWYSPPGVQRLYNPLNLSEGTTGNLFLANRVSTAGVFFTCWATREAQQSRRDVKTSLSRVCYILWISIIRKLPPCWQHQHPSRLLAGFGEANFHEFYGLKDRNSAKELSELEGRPYPAGSPDETPAPAITLIEVCWKSSWVITRLWLTESVTW